MREFKRKKIVQFPGEFSKMREAPGTVIEARGSEIDQGTINLLSSTLERVAHKQEKGVVFVVGSGKDHTKDEDGNIAPSGALFTHKMNPLEAVMLMIESSGIDVSLLMIALLSDNKLF